MTKFYTDKKKRVRPISNRTTGVGSYQTGTAHLNVPRRIQHKSKYEVLTINTKVTGEGYYEYVEPLYLGSINSRSIEVVYDPKLEHEAEYMWNQKGKIHVGNKFIELTKTSSKGAKHVLVHELGHLFENRELRLNNEEKNTFENYLQTSGHYAQWNEGFAESFAEFIDYDKETWAMRNPQVYEAHIQLQKEYPEYYALGSKIMNSQLKVQAK